MGFMEKIRNFFTMEEDDISEDLEHDKPRWKGKLVSLTASRHNAIVLMEPTTFAEAQEVGDHLKNRAAILVNLSGLDHELATRILDFASGMTYALSGTMQKISDAIFLFAPSSVTVIPIPKKMELSTHSEFTMKRDTA